MVVIAQLRVSTPKSSQELSRLVQQRDELRGQLQATTQQRGDLAAQVQGLGDPVVRSGPLARLAALDDRIRSLEGDVQSLDKVIADAKASGVSGGEEQTVVFSPPPAMPLIPAPPFEWTTEPPTWRGRVVNSLEVNGPITLASVVLVGVLIYWRISRSMRAQFARLQATQSGALTQLQQSLDTVAVEIERVSENQRFVTKLVGEKGQPVERR